MLTGFILALLCAPASAQDDEWDLDDDIVFEDEQPAPQPAPAPTSEEPTPPPQPDDGDEKDDGLEDFRDPAEEIDLLGEEDPAAPMGADSEQVYRATAERLSQLGADEELAGWEEYLATYPNTVFRTRIEQRMETMMDELYATSIDRDPRGGGVDAMRQEIDFAHAMQLENLNPRTRLQLGFEWGLPDYMNLFADYEHQLQRTLSVHGGIKRRYQGWNIEAGPRWAIVKSTRTNTIVSLIGDVHVNTIPFYPAFRPQLAAGTRVGPVDMQLQGGVDLEFRTFENPDTLAKESALHSRIIGGASLFFAASDRVGMFAETSLHMKPQPADGAFDGGLFAFNVVTFGMKFFPASKNRPEAKDMEVNLGATVPYMQEYLRYHYGSVMGQMNYYL